MHEMNHHKPSALLGGIVFLLTSGLLVAQAPSATLSGVITDPSGGVAANAKVSIKNLATNQSVEVQTNSAGLYAAPNLVPGEYEVSISGEGFGVKTTQLTLTAGARQTLNQTLSTGSGDAAGPSLGDLGFGPQAQGSAQDQARLDRRTHMLMMHQRLGLITLAPLVATLVASGGAAGKNSSSTGRNIHEGLGIVTAGMYFTTASYAIRAPKIPGTITRGPIRLHKTLAWVHGTGMILTPILGAMAYDQRSKGEKVHGIASAHGAVAAVTGIAYAAAILSVTLKF